MMGILCFEAFNRTSEKSSLLQQPVFELYTEIEALVSPAVGELLFLTQSICLAHQQ